MVFSSAIFLFAFFPIALALYHLARGMRAKNTVLLILSLAFYCFGSVRYVPLLALSVAVNWAAGRALGRLEDKKKRRAAATAAVVFDVAVMAVFKYLDFILENINALLGTAIPLPGLPMPLGVSFFTFTAMSYVIEVYRRPRNMAASFLDAAVYISLFPVILSGPITGWRVAAPQLRERTCTLEKTALGLRRFIVGMGKKLLIADIVGRVVDGAFASPVLDMRLAWLGAVGYAVQIYFDFAGYTDMAIGIGQCFGFALPENFDRPYTARSMTDFWKRWHMSLTGWFREYVYMPIAMGKMQRRLYKRWSERYGRAKANRLSILLPSAAVWLLTGLWHGAAWSFVLWGAWHGLFCVLEGVGVLRTKALERFAVGRMALHVYTWMVVLLADVLFRAESMAQAGAFYKAMFDPWHMLPAVTYQMQTLLNGVALASLGAGLLLCFARRGLEGPERPWERPVSYVLCLGLLALCIMRMAQSGFVPFIYLQF